jgi:hypothetical protein
LTIIETIATELNIKSLNLRDLLGQIFFKMLKIKYKPSYEHSIAGDFMDKQSEELMKKCENMDDTSVMGSCEVLLKMMKDKNVTLEDDPNQTYLGMAENLTPKDVSKVLQLALKVRESGDIKDPELKNAASRIIRAIEMS